MQLELSFIGSLIELSRCDQSKSFLHMLNNNYLTSQESAISRTVPIGRAVVIGRWNRWIRKLQNNMHRIESYT
mgnify:CR=1 FL=1